MKIKVHPLFIALALVMILCGRAFAFLWTFVAVSLHELGHAAVARTRGYLVKTLVILPFGAVMSSEESFDKASSVLIGAAGPAVNAVLALITLGTWWLFPAIYPATELFFYANLSLAAFNLLPVYPLDGSRIVLGLCKNRVRAVKGLQIAGVAVSVALFALFVVSAFFTVNFTFGVLAVFLFYGAAIGTKEELYVSVFSPSVKDYDCGVEEKAVRISEKAPVSRLFRFVNPNASTEFKLTDGEGNTVLRLSEKDLKGIALNCKLTEQIGSAARKNRAENRE